MKKILGIKTTIHGNVYKKYFFWLPLLKLVYKDNLVKVFLLGVQITQVHNPRTNPIINNIVNTDDARNKLFNTQMLQMRSVECIKSRKDINYLKGKNK